MYLTRQSRLAVLAKSIGVLHAQGRDDNLMPRRIVLRGSDYVGVLLEHTYLDRAETPCDSYRCKPKTNQVIHRVKHGQSRDSLLSRRDQCVWARDAVAM